MKSPAFQFYPTDYLGSQRVQMMTLEEEGAYCRLLWSCWQHGSIPADPELAARLVGKGCSATIARMVLPMFEVDCGNGRLTHDRLEREREKQAVWREKSSLGGKKSAETRQNGKCGSTTLPTTLQPPYQPKGNIPTPSPSLSPSPIPSPSPDSDKTPPNPKPPKKPRAAAPPLECVEFAKFWLAYPKRLGKANAEKAWLKHGCAAKIDAILRAVEQWSRSDSWTKDGGQFIPHPATWINRRGWEDEAVDPANLIPLHTQKSAKYGW